MLGTDGALVALGGAFATAVPDAVLPDAVTAPVLREVIDSTRTSDHVMASGTIRHYDDVGLVAPSNRSAGGFRLYTDDDVARLEFIKTLRPLELSLEQVQDLLVAMDTATSGDDTSPSTLAQLSEFRDCAEERIATMRAQIRDLEDLTTRLDGITSTTGRMRDQAS